MSLPTSPTPSTRWPWQRSLQTRLVVAYGGLFLVVLALLMAVVVRVVYQAQLSDAEHNLKIQAFLAANALEDPLSGYASEFEEYARWESERDHRGEDGLSDDDHSDDDHRPQTTGPDGAGIARRLQAVASLYASDTNARITILEPQGDAVADSTYPFTEVANQFSQIEVQAALDGKEQHDIRLDEFTGRLTIYAAAPIQQNGQLLGVVQIAQPMDEITGAIARLALSLVAAGLFALAATTGLGIWISRRLVQPVRGLEAASLAIAQGDLSQQVPVTSADELGALARAFNRMVGELQRMIEQQRLFIANASHELRTPLTNIKLRSEALLGGLLDERTMAERYLAEIDSEADRLTRLANTLLDLSRLENDHHPLPTSEVDLIPVFAGVVQALSLRFGKANQRLHIELPDQLPGLRVWPEQAEAIVVNLLDNAIKFTPPGGDVHLSAQVVDGECRIRVEDTGPGIPTDELPLIFQRFYRVDKARSRYQNRNAIGTGAGLGLSIVAALVTQNRGRIWAENSPAGGAAFTVAFPLSQRADP
jgi:two-component system OmpR family sensor kinase